MRIDKFLAHKAFGTRKEVHDLIKQGLVKVNDSIVKKKDMHINPDVDVVTVQDQVVQAQLEYYIKSPKRNDVIVYKQSNKEHSYFEIKRVIGLPGETVKIKNGIVYINDEAIKEKVKTEAISNSGLAEEGVKLDDNEYFVLGDNRNDSEDSRFAGIGNVLKNEILGKAVATEKPFSLVDSLNLAD